MGPMDWDRVNRQNRSWRTYDYSAAMDAGDEAVQLEVAVEGVSDRSILAIHLRRNADSNSTTAVGMATTPASKRRRSASVTKLRHVVVASPLAR